MSTRYVWGKYNTVTVYNEKNGSTSDTTFYDSTLAIDPSGYLTANYLKISTGYSFNKSTGGFTLTGSTSAVKLNDSTNNAYTYIYAAPYNSGEPSTIWYNKNKASGDFWDVDLTVGNPVYYPNLYLKNGSTKKSFGVLYSEGGEGKRRFRFKCNE